MTSTSETPIPRSPSSYHDVVPYTSLHVEQDKRMVKVGTEMKHKFVGPIEPKKFLDDFLPQVTPRTGRFMKQQFYEVGHGTDVDGELEMYEIMMKHSAKYCPDLKLINTSGQSDDANWEHQPGLLKPDISAYTKESGVVYNDFTRTEFFMEFKWKEGDDGFDDSDKGPFEKATQQATDTRGQLSTYAGALLISQFRTHAFSVQITRDYARLIRWDRAGAIVTRKFCYYEEPFLVDFLWRYNYASAEARGHDPTVTELKDRSHAKKVRAALGIEESQRVWKFVLIDENGEEHHFFGGKVAFKGVGVPASRATRGFLVVDSQGNRRYLKDTWRILSDTIQKEGDVYALLKEHNVPHVPDVIVSGNAVGDWQRTKTHEYVTPTFQDAVLRNHQHYFIVFAQVGTPLKDFKNSFELVQATSHAIEAHKVAYEKAKILHRDISVGNILIMDGGQGLLIDWEFSKPLDSSAPRTLERTGTWQFMSARLLSHKPGEVNHILADDLESFYHVLCWVTLMHGRHELSKEDAENQIARVYDGWNGVKASDVKGGSDKIVDLQKKWMAKQAKLAEGPLRDLVVGLEDLLLARYLEPSKYVNQDMINVELKKLDDSTWFLDSFSQALQHEEQLKSQERDPIRAISLPAMGDDDPNNRKRKKTDSELQEEDEDEDEERPSRRPRTSES